MGTKLGDAEHLPVVLGVESSCDETGFALVQGNKLLANAVASSMEEHIIFGGVVPEVASRAHLQSLVATLEECLAEAKMNLKQIDAIAVTAGPGLAGALMVGVAAAKAFALALDVPIFGVNHLIGHIAVDALEHGPLPQPTMALLVSGGHSNLLLVQDIARDITSLGASIDDAAGEAYDKVARVLGLPYPGGPHVDALATAGNSAAIAFPRGLMAGKDMQKHRYDFSFSGLKTAVWRHVTQAQQRGENLNLSDVAASFQEAVVDVLMKKTIWACQENNVKNLLLGGGVSANSRLRAVAQERCAAAGITLRIPPAKLCTDNGAMAAALGSQLLQAQAKPSELNFAADSSLPIEVIQV